MKTLLGYQQQDIGNKMGWLQGMTGAMGQDTTGKQGYLGLNQNWMNSMIPYEQWNIQTPINFQNEAQAARWNQAMAQENINANRRGEAMGWLNSLMGYQGQQGQQYYQGQGNYQNYNANRGQAQLGGYGNQWLGYM
jgi:hypothetical protein